MKMVCLPCLLMLSVAGAIASGADGFSNPDFENGKTDGWTVGGRKDARAKVVSTRAIFDRLSQSRRFRGMGGWERHPLAKKLDRSNNKFMLQISSNGYITAETHSTVRIEAGKQYAVSLIGQSGNGGDAIYYLDVYGIGDDGKRLPLGTGQSTIREGELFRQVVTFAAAAGEPHIGRRIGLSARYRGTNLLDNAAIEISPVSEEGIAGAVRSLPLVNTLDEAGNSRFAIRGFDDFQYTKSVAKAGSLENMGASFASLARWVPKDHPEYTLFDLEGLTLADGEAAAITVGLIDPRAYAGFAVDGRVFLLGRHGNRKKKRDDGSGINPFRTPDYMMYIAKVSRELGPETMVIARAGDRIDWFACGRKGSYTIKDLAGTPRLSLFARRRSTMSQFRKGKLSDKAKAYLQTFMPAPHHPHGRPNTPGFPGIRRTDPRAFAAAISTDLSKPLSDAEVQAMAAYVANYNAHGFGTHADPIFSLPGWYVPARVFLITRSREVLNHLIRIADPAIIIRNGFEVDGVKYGVKFAGEFNRYLNLHDYCVFPEGGFGSEADQGGRYFNEKHEYVRDEISRTSDSANARMITPSLTAYCIALHPEIWDQTVPDGDPCRLGATYRRRAERYIRELALNYTDYKDYKLYNFQTEFIWDNYTEFHKDKAIYEARLEAWNQKRGAVRGDVAMAEFLKVNPKPKPKERRAGINRFVAATSCAGFAAHAAETFGDKVSMKAIDACGEKILKSWFNTFQFYAPGHDGQFLKEQDKWYRAWGYQPNCVNPMARDYDTNTPRGKGQVRGEDRAHMNFTMKSFYVHYQSHRYEHIMTRERMTDLARTFNEMVLPKYNQWRPLPRASKHPNVDPVDGIGGVRIHPLLMFADFNPELKQKVVQAMVEGTHERGLVINRVLLAEMRAKKHRQIPTKIVK